MEGLATWELVGVLVGIAVGVTTILSLVFWAGIKIGGLATRHDLKDMGDRLDKKIDDTRTDLEKAIAGTRTDLEKAIADTRTDLEKTIADNARRTDERFDEVMAAINDLGIRLETAIMDHTHDADGVAVFRRHPQMADMGD